jgi:fucose permease
MKHLPIKISLFINYFVFAILLNSVGTVILQVQNSYGVTESSAAILEAFKDLSIALTSFLIASFIVRVGYKRTMLAALAFIGIVCLAMPQVPTFWMTKLMFAATGAGFALVKVSCYATLGLVTEDSKEHVSIMNFLESFFMVGVLSGYFIFSAFVDDSDPSSTSWLTVYYVLAALSFLAFALLMFAKLDESAAKSSAPKPLLQEFIDMMALCIKPLVLIFVISAFLYVLIEQSIMSWLPTEHHVVVTDVQQPHSPSFDVIEHSDGQHPRGRNSIGPIHCRVRTEEIRLVRGTRHRARVRGITRAHRIAAGRVFG